MIISLIRQFKLDAKNSEKLISSTRYINKKSKNNIQLTFFFVCLIQLVYPVFFLTWGCGVTADRPNLILQIR
ncbi:hypothetical protein BpHYR1_008565 [Brachionus plicatilis]|uniref:Uncharacterized protein n=1 Tax=Brachionus plicatilis TaxID=10195 RepID=A0A3M7RV45_BRAPC|nr:hypothetical protein BpHYR1_008565 [Brachionus plicatilis]